MLSPRKTTVSPSRRANSACADPKQDRARPSHPTARASDRPGRARFVAMSRFLFRYVRAHDILCINGCSGSAPVGTGAGGLGFAGRPEAAEDFRLAQVIGPQLKDRLGARLGPELLAPFGALIDSLDHRLHRTGHDRRSF